MNCKQNKHRGNTLRHIIIKLLKQRDWVKTDYLHTYKTQLFSQQKKGGGGVGGNEARKQWNDSFEVLEKEF